MSQKNKTKVPGNGGQDTKESPFQIRWPDPTIEDTDDIERPKQIVEEFQEYAEPFQLHKFLLDHLMDLVSGNFFEAYTQLGLTVFMSNYYFIADTVFKLEKHVADKNMEYGIVHFLELVLRKDEAEVSPIKQAIKEVIDKYGSLNNGLHHFAEDYRRIRVNEKSNSATNK